MFPNDADMRLRGTKIIWTKYGFEHNKHSSNTISKIENQIYWPWIKEEERKIQNWNHGRDLKPFWTIEHNSNFFAVIVTIFFQHTIDQIASLLNQQIKRFSHEHNRFLQQKIIKWDWCEKIIHIFWKENRDIDTLMKTNWSFKCMQPNTLLFVLTRAIQAIMKWLRENGRVKCASKSDGASPKEG